MSETNSHGVTTSATDYEYFNPVPGSKGASVAGAVVDGVVVTTGPYTPSTNPFVDNVTDPTETTHQALNPAYDPANETYLDSQQQEGFPSAADYAAGPPGDADNPVAEEEARDTGAADLDASPGGESEA